MYDISIDLCNAITQLSINSCILKDTNYILLKLN